jgi:hypothetical protein
LVPGALSQIRHRVRPPVGGDELVEDHILDHGSVTELLAAPPVEVRLLRRACGRTASSGDCRPPAGDRASRLLARLAGGNPGRRGRPARWWRLSTTVLTTRAEARRLLAARGVDGVELLEIRVQSRGLGRDELRSTTDIDLGRSDDEQAAVADNSVFPSLVTATDTISRALREA